MRRQRVSVRLERGQVDLGSVMVRRASLLTANASFLPRSLFTTDLFARDYFWARQVLDVLPAVQIDAVENAIENRNNTVFSTLSSSQPDVHLVNEVLLIHQ